MLWTSCVVHSLWVEICVAKLSVAVLAVSVSAVSVIFEILVRSSPPRHVARHALCRLPALSRSLPVLWSQSTHGFSKAFGLKHPTADVSFLSLAGLVTASPA